MIPQILGTQWGCKVQHQNIYREISFIKTSVCYIFKDNFWKHSDINSIGPVYFKLLSQVMSNWAQGWMQSLTKYQMNYNETFSFLYFNATVCEISKKYFLFYCHSVNFYFKVVFRLFLYLEKLRIHFSNTHLKDQYLLLPPLSWYTQLTCKNLMVQWGNHINSSKISRSPQLWYI